MTKALEAPSALLPPFKRRGEHLVEILRVDSAMVQGGVKARRRLIRSLLKILSYLMISY